MPLTFTFTVPDGDRNRVLNAFARKYGYSDTVPDGNGGQVANPESRAQFSKRIVAEFIKGVVRDSEVDQASRDAGAAAAAAAPPSIA